MKTYYFILTLLLSIFSYSQNPSDELTPFASSGKCGYINSKEEIVVPAIYNTATYNYDKSNIYIVTLEESNSKKQLYGLYNNKGELLLGFENRYDSISITNQNKGVIMVRKDGKYGFVNKENKIKVSIVYDYLGWIGDDGQVSAKKNGKYGIIDLEEKIIVAFEYENEFTLSKIQNDNHRYASVSLNGKYGCIKENGEVIIPFSYDYLSLTDNYGFIVGQKNRNYGLIDLKENIIIKFQYENEFQFSETQSDNHKYAAVSLNGKYGYINEDGKIKIPHSYDSGNIFYKDVAEVGKKGKKGLINLNGKIVIPFIYDSIFINYENQIICILEEMSRDRFIYDLNGNFIEKRKR